MVSVFINVAAVLLGGTLGLFFNRSFPQRIADTVMKGLALCVLYIGISGALERSEERRVGKECRL